MGKKCAFFGHRDLFGKSEQIADVLHHIIIDLIHHGVDVFYVGNHGEFDILSSKIACDLKTIYPQIQVVVVLCYPNELQYLKCQFTDFIMPVEIEKAPKRASIIKRNQWVVDNTDCVVCYICDKIGGAYRAVQYAQKHKKKIINLNLC